MPGQSRRTAILLGLGIDARDSNTYDETIAHLYDTREFEYNYLL